MVIPPYCKLDKRAQDIFTKNYNLGVYKVDVLTRTSTGVQCGLSGESMTETGQIQAQLKTKYTLDQWGCTFSEKWTTENAIISKVTFQDLVLKGSKVLFDAKLAPQSSKKSGMMQVALENDYLNVSTNFDLNETDKSVQGSIVVGHRGWLAGGQVSFNPRQPSKVNKASVAVGFQEENFQVVGSFNEMMQFSGSVHQNIANDLEGAVSFTCSTSSVSPNITIGCLWRKDANAQVKCRINTKSVIGVAYTRQLGPGLAITFNAQVDGTNMANGTRQLGLGIQLQL